MKTILVVEDEPDILENNRKALEDAGFTALTAASVAQAREQLKNQNPDAIILDIMLPDGNGLDLLRELRQSGNRVPVMMLTAWGKPSDVVRGLKLGANDYLSKPFTYKVLLARVETMFRNVEQIPQIIVKGNLTLKIAQMTAFIDDTDMGLNPKEFTMLLLFAENEGRVLSAESIYKRVWNAPLLENTGALRKTISTLRKKLAGSDYELTAEYGEGYCFRKK